MKKTNKTKFYEISQNNSGGNFDVNDKLCRRLFIEADSENIALNKAVKLGVYFDGVSREIDCSCCGDRWSRYTSELTFPFVYDEHQKIIFKNVVDYAQYIANTYGWENVQPDARIYYKNGKVKEIVSKLKK